MTDPRTLIQTADAVTDAALTALAAGVVKPGPVPGNLVPPQIWDGSDDLFPKGTTGTGRVFAASGVVSGASSYLELWYADSEKILDAAKLTIGYKSGQAVNWIATLAELANLALAAAAGSVPVYAVARYQYRDPVLDVPAWAALDGIVGTSWDASNVKGGVASVNGRLYRQLWAKDGSKVFIDHWLLAPAYSPPYLDVQLALAVRGPEKLSQFFSATAVDAKWRYAQLVYTRDTKPPAAADLEKI